MKLLKSFILSYALLPSCLLCMAKPPKTILKGHLSLHNKLEAIIAYRIINRVEGIDPETRNRFNNNTMVFGGQISPNQIEVARSMITLGNLPVWGNPLQLVITHGESRKECSQQLTQLGRYHIEPDGETVKITGPHQPE